MPYFFWPFLLVVAVTGGIGAAIASRRGLHPLLGFAAGALGTVGTYALLRYRGSMLRESRTLSTEAIRSALRVLYSTSAMGLALFSAVQILWLVQMALIGPTEEMLRFFEEPSAWFIGLVGVGGSTLLWLLCLYVVVRDRRIPNRSEAIGLLIVFNFFGAYWWLSEPAAPPHADAHSA